MKGRVRDRGEPPPAPKPDDASGGVYLRRRKRKQREKVAEALASNAELEREARKALAQPLSRREEIEVRLLEDGSIEVNRRKKPRKAAPKKRETAPKVVEYEAREYTSDDPASGLADRSQQARMRDNRNIGAAEALAKARAGLAMSRLLTTYEVLKRHSDLKNPALDQAERLRRSRHLLMTYLRLRKVNPTFHDDGEQLKAARSIVNKVQYQRRKAKLAAQATKL